jgi:hypothetical protein
MITVDEPVNIFINDRHEYDYFKIILGGETKHELAYSEDIMWTTDLRGSSAAAIVDNGDGYEILGNAKPDKKGFIDYHDAQQLEILLRLADLDQTNKFEIVECKRIQF